MVPDLAGEALKWIKDYGALTVSLAIALYLIYKGAFVTRLHHTEVCDGYEKRIKEQEERIEKLEDSNFRYQQITTQSVVWGRATAESALIQAKQLPDKNAEHP